MTKISDYIKYPVRYVEGSGTMVFDENDNHISDTRGWGRLQKLDNGDKIQDDITKFIAQAINDKLGGLSLNQKAVVYPKQRGWDMIQSIVSDFDEFDEDEVNDWILSRTTEDGGFSESFLTLINSFTGLFSMTNTYLVSSNVKFLPLS